MLANNPHIKYRLAQLAIDVDAGRAFSYSVVCTQIKEGLVKAGPMAAAAKVLATELLQDVTYAGCELMGLYGQVKDSRWAPMQGRFEKDYQVCLGLKMGGGTSEVMRNLICSMELGLPRP